MNHLRVFLLDACLVFLSNLIFHASAICPASQISLTVNDDTINKKTYYVNLANFNDNVTVSCEDAESRCRGITLQLDQSSSTFNLERGSVTMSKDNFVPGTYRCKDNSDERKIKILRRAPTLVVSSAVLRAYKAQAVILPCELENVYRSVNYKVCWTKQDERLPNSCTTKRGDQISIATFSHLLANVSSKHVGTYKCQVEAIDGDSMSGKYIISSPVVLQVSEERPVTINMRMNIHLHGNKTSTHNIEINSL